jgi:uncharacterized membrane-anchored protein
LQTAVETLSVVAVAYYLLGLISYVLKGAVHLGAKLDVEVTLGAAAPLLLLLAWGAMRVVRKRFRDPSGEGDE